MCIRIYIYIYIYVYTCYIHVIYVYIYIYIHIYIYRERERERERERDSHSHHIKPVSNETQGAERGEAGCTPPVRANNHPCKVRIPMSRVEISEGFPLSGGILPLKRKDLLGSKPRIPRLPTWIGRTRHVSTRYPYAPVPPTTHHTPTRPFATSTRLPANPAAAHFLRARVRTVAPRSLAHPVAARGSCPAVSARRGDCFRRVRVRGVSFHDLSKRGMSNRMFIKRIRKPSHHWLIMMPMSRMPIEFRTAMQLTRRMDTMHIIRIRCRFTCARGSSP